MATLEGGIQAPPPSWDPYAPPVASPNTLLPQDPYYPGQMPGFSADGTIATMRKFLQELRLDYHWFAGHGSTQKELGINDIETSATFAIPFLWNAQVPLLITPGFAMHFWDGPMPVGTPPPDMPARTYDAYLDAAWHPRATDYFGGDLSFRIGVYSDFRKWDNDEIRFSGTGLAVLAFSPAIQVKAGVWYLDRNRVKILPAGGIVWTPNADTRFDILFPNPKLARRLTTVGTTEWWAYARGEYGGGTWSIQRTDGTLATVDYNDIRFAMGTEFVRQQGFKGRFEVGVSFERELYYHPPEPRLFKPNPTVFLGAGLSY